MSPRAVAIAPPDRAGRKAALRERMKARLDRVQGEDARAVGRAVAARLEADPGWSSVETIAAFSSLRDEVDTRPILEAAWRSGKRVLLPRMMREEGGLEFAVVERTSPLVVARFAVREPLADAPRHDLVDPRTWVLVPGLAFDAQGGRLGRGAGYYDRALSSSRAHAAGPRLLGVAFSFQIVCEVPMTPLDVRLDGVVTEREAFLVSGPSAARS